MQILGAQLLKPQLKDLLLEDHLLHNQPHLEELLNNLNLFLVEHPQHLLEELSGPHHSHKVPRLKILVLLNNNRVIHLAVHLAPLHQLEEDLLSGLLSKITIKVEGYLVHQSHKEVVDFLGNQTARVAGMERLVVAFMNVNHYGELVCGL